jgi:multicomponent K+:H+ antiporter subunit E
MLGRILPQPILSVVIVIVWLFLQNAFSMGHLVLGIIVGIAVPLFTSSYWPDRPRIRNIPMIVSFILVVLWDIVVSNVIVAYIVLFRKNESLRSRFITVPLDLRTPEAISLLSGTITMTPGTVSSDLSADGRSLLVHCLETDTPDEVIATIKNRYERRLKEIFE